MQSNFIQPNYIRASNDAYASTAESIIIDAVILGFSGFNITVTNYGPTITDISVYGSADGQHYYTIQGAAIGSISTNSTSNYAGTNTDRYIRVTATSSSSSHISCCLIGE